MSRRKGDDLEEITNKLREAKVGLASGKTVPGACRGLGLLEQTYDLWRKG
ncbi:MAG: hypothetical protein V3U93_00740 [Alphaproteobacteria bacterium]